MSEYETVIGIEAHAELSTESKIFCGCPTAFGAPPNTQVCPVCLGMPGVLPVLNREAMESAVKVGLALNCAIAPRFKFDRKHYYYPDLPKNFQISQYDLPVAEHGALELPGGRTIRIRRAHLEEDAGKLVHEGEDEKIGSATAALVDYNRSGVPLLEIVSEPDISSAEEAVEYLKILQAIIRYLDVSTGNMEEGSLRCEINVSLRPAGTQDLGTKVEIKNLNSFKAVERSLQYEIARQAEALKRGETVSQETRLYDEAAGATRAMRGKEHAHDYRYFPEPDLPPFFVDSATLDRIRRNLPELPAARRTRFVSAYGLSDYDADVLISDKEIADYFEETISAEDGKPAANPKMACNWITSEGLASVKTEKADVSEIKLKRVKPSQLRDLIRLIESGTISGKIAKSVFDGIVETGKDPETIVREQDLSQISDEGALRETVAKLLKEHPRSVEDYRAGKKQAFGFLVGQAMKATQGKANPKLVNKLLREEIEKT